MRRERFYSPVLLPECQTADQHIRRSRCDFGPWPSAMRPWAPGLVHGRVRKDPRTGPVGAVTPTVLPCFSPLTCYFRLPVSAGWSWPDPIQCPVISHSS